MNNVGSKSPADDANALESAIGGKLAVWVGAVALALGGVFLVKYTIDQGLLAPIYRVLGGLALAVTCGATAWRLRDRSNYVAQGLGAAGVICAYACLWAAADLYDLIHPLASMAGMVAVTVLAVVGALRLGPLVAIIGLLGAFLAPLLVGRADPNPIGLFAYLLALQAGAQFVARRRRWVWASGLSIVAGTAWVLLHLLGGGEEFWPGVFLLGSTTLFVLPVLLRNDDEKQSSLMVWIGSAVGTLLLALTLGISGFDSNIWALYGVLIAGSGVLAILKRRFSSLPLVTFGATLVLAALQVAGKTWAPLDTLCLLMALGMLYVAIGYAGIWRDGGAASHSLVAAAPAAFLLVGLPFLYVEINAINPYAWMVVLLATGLVYILLSIPTLIGRHLLHEHSVSSVLIPALLLPAVAWPFGLEFRWCVLLWAVQMVSAGVLDRKYGLEGVRFAGVLLLVATGIGLLPPLCLIIGDDLTGQPPVMNHLTLVYVVGFAACVLCRQLARNANSRALYSVSALVVLLVGCSLNIHHVANGSLTALSMGALEVSAHVMVALLMSTWLIGRAPHAHAKDTGIEATTLRGFGLGLGMVALTAGAFLIATAGNPWIRHEPVQGLILLNGLVFTTWLPIALMGVLSMLLGARGYSQQRLLGWWITGGLIVMGVMLEVRHMFHGAELWKGAAVDAEHYAYSLSIVLLSMLALGLGIYRNSRQLRVIALVGMLAGSLKVFTYDMRHLEGIYRVLSFLGLGVSLMALGYIYNRFGPKALPKPEPETLELPAYESILTETAPL